MFFAVALTGRFVIGLVACTLVCTSLALAQGNNGTGVDTTDLVNNSRHLLEKRSPSGSLGNVAYVTIAKNWDEQEEQFLANLSYSEKAAYHDVKMEFEQLQVEADGFRNIVSNQTPEDRSALIEQRTLEINNRLDSLYQEVDTRLSLEQQKARQVHRTEIQRKRQEIKAHLDKVRQKVHDRINQGSGG